MGMVARLAAASALQTILLCTPAFAATFLPVTPPTGAIDSAVIGLNDQGDVAGSYTTTGDDLIGFTGPASGAYESFNANGQPTQARGLNNQGFIVGFSLPDGSLNEFARKKNGTIDTIVKAGSALIGIAQGVNAAGDFVGDYLRDPGSTPLRGGYKGKNAAWTADVDLPFPAVRVAPRAVNSKGDIAGWFIAEAGGAVQGFVIKNGVTTVLSFPGSDVTFIQGMNNKGEFSGSYEDASGVSHGFALDSNLVSWTSFDAPGATNTQAWQINNLGQIAVTGDGGNAIFIYCPKKAGVCNGGPKEKPASVSASRGQADQHEPNLGRSARDPDQSNGRKNRQ